MLTLRSNVVAIALPEIPPGTRLVGGLYTPVEILSNHHARLLRLVEDFGPKYGDKFIFPNYLFLVGKPPSWFWGVTGVVKCLRGRVSCAELDRVAAAYEILLERAVVKPEAPTFLERAVVEVRSVDGRVIASVNMFGRKLEARVC